MDFPWANLFNYTDSIDGDLENLVENEYNKGIESHNYSEISDNEYSSTTEFSNSWRDLPILQWCQNDVFEWLQSFAVENRFDLSQFRFENFSHIVDGTYLYSMSLDSFLACDSQYGKYLYDSIHNSHIFEILPRFEYLKTPSEIECHFNQLCEGKYDQTPNNIPFSYRPDTIEPFDFNPNLPAVLPASSSDEDDESINGADPVSPIITVRRGRGRPRGKGNSTKKKVTTNNVGCLWEFIRNLLHDPNYCPTIIRWENHEEGLFRFVKPDVIANLWGSRKSNQRMDYAKFSRALRYYYKLDIFQSVGNRRLVYKFGPTAQGWKTNDPNFEKRSR